MRSGADRDRSGGGSSEAVASELDGRGVDQLAADVDISVVTSGIDDTFTSETLLHGNHFHGPQIDAK
jgi:hypothetical protein